MLSTVKETVTGATGYAANATATVVEKAIGMVETYDADSVERPKQFGGIEGEKGEPTEQIADEDKSSEGNAKDKNAELDQSLRRLKVVSGDLLDLWLYEGSKGL